METKTVTVDDYRNKDCYKEVVKAHEDLYRSIFPPPVPPSFNPAKHMVAHLHFSVQSWYLYPGTEEGKESFKGYIKNVIDGFKRLTVDWEGTWRIYADNVLKKLEALYEAFDATDVCEVIADEDE